MGEILQIWEFAVIVAEVLNELGEEKLEPSQWLKTKCESCGREV